jgi:hypothetical protein
MFWPMPRNMMFHVHRAEAAEKILQKESVMVWLVASAIVLPKMAGV